MAYTVKSWAACEYCGEPTNRKARRSHKRMCVPCGERRLLESVVGQANRTGEAYTNMLAATARGVARRLAALTDGNQSEATPTEQ